ANPGSRHPSPVASVTPVLTHPHRPGRPPPAHHTPPRPNSPRRHSRSCPESTESSKPESLAPPHRRVSSCPRPPIPTLNYSTPPPSSPTGLRAANRRSPSVFDWGNILTWSLVLGPWL